MLYSLLLEELERATDGAHILANFALISSEFKEMMVLRFVGMIKEIDKVRTISDSDKMRELLPVIYEER